MEKFDFDDALMESGWQDKMDFKAIETAIFQIIGAIGDFGTQHDRLVGFGDTTPDGNHLAAGRCCRHAH